MKYLLTACLISFLSLTTVAQSTYEITETNNVSNIQDYKDAIEEADMDMYRYEDRRRILTFKSGVVVSLHSTNEIKAMGITPKSDPAPYIEGKEEPLCILNQGGHLIMAYSVKGKHYPKEFYRSK